MSALCCLTDPSIDTADFNSKVPRPNIPQDYIYPTHLPIGYHLSSALVHTLAVACTYPLKLHAVFGFPCFCFSTHERKGGRRYFHLQHYFQQPRGWSTIISTHSRACPLNFAMRYGASVCRIGCTRSTALSTTSSSGQETLTTLRIPVHSHRLVRAMSARRYSREFAVSRAESPLPEENGHQCLAGVEDQSIVLRIEEQADLSGLEQQALLPGRRVKLIGRPAKL